MSLNSQFCSNLVMKRVQKTTQLMQSIQKLHDPQSELLLSRNCTGVSRLFFSLRTTCPQVLQEVTEIFDYQLMKYLRQLIVGDGAGFGLVQQRMATLPIKYGGLGVYTMTDTSKYCYLASYTQTQHLQNTILQNTIAIESSHLYQHALQGI